MPDLAVPFRLFLLDYRPDRRVMFDPTEPGLATPQFRSEALSRLGSINLNPNADIKNTEYIDGEIFLEGLLVFIFCRRK